jgi:hypothetical protein
LAHTSQIREDQLELRREYFGNAAPIAMVNWKRMEEDDRRPVALNFVKDLGIAATDDHATILARRRDLLCHGGCVIERSRLLGYHDPADQVSNQAAPAKDRYDQPNNAHQDNVEIEVLGQSSTDAREPVLRARAQEPSTRRSESNAATAVSTVNGIILDHLTAVIAVHDDLPHQKIREERRKVP